MRGEQQVKDMMLTPDVAPVKHLYEKYNQIEIENEFEESFNNNPFID